MGDGKNSWSMQGTQNMFAIKTTFTLACIFEGVTWHGMLLGSYHLVISVGEWGSGRSSWRRNTSEKFLEWAVSNDRGHEVF